LLTNTAASPKAIENTISSTVKAIAICWAC
jgi:hypothetical protein